MDSIFSTQLYFQQAAYHALSLGASREKWVLSRNHGSPKHNPVAHLISCGVPGILQWCEVEGYVKESLEIVQAKILESNMANSHLEIVRSS